MIKLLLLAAVALAVQAQLFMPSSDQCHSDSDCMSGCCHDDHFLGHRCHPYSNHSSPCHLANHAIHTMLYPCGCAAGLTCTQIHFNMSDLPDKIHDVEHMMLGHGYGWCQ